MARTDVGSYWEGMHSGATGMAGVGYAGFGDAFNRWMYRVRRHVFLATVRPYLTGLDDPAVLDVGSGTGFYLDRWRELGVRRITGSDLTHAAVDRLRARYPALDLHRLDIGGADAVGPARFDIVSAFDVLFHIVDDARYRSAFRNLGALVEPGGLLVFSENFLRGSRRRADPVQVSRSLEEIESLLARNGFEPLVRRRMFYLMNFPADSTNRVHITAWKVLARAIVARNGLGTVAGPLLYPIERVLVARPREGPSTEIMVCRRRPA